MIDEQVVIQPGLWLVEPRAGVDLVDATVCFRVRLWNQTTCDFVAGDWSRLADKQGPRGAAQVTFEKGGKARGPINPVVTGGLQSLRKYCDPFCTIFAWVEFLKCS